MNQNRIQRVLEKMRQTGLTQMIIGDPCSIRYLTGVRIQPGERMLALLLRVDGDHRLFVNRLFTAGDTSIPVEYFDDTQDAPALLAKRLDPAETVGIDKKWSAGFLLRLLELNAAAGYVNGSPCVDLVRAVKDEEELKLMRYSSKINDLCMSEFAASLYYGITEREMERVCREIYQAHGCEGVSFTPIAAFGANAADPHHENGDTVLRPGMMVLLDVGCVCGDYCSDMTRTFFTAPPTAHQLQVYNLVRRANEAAEEMIRPGVRLCDIDKTARDVISSGGFGRYFTHRLGHFIGLEDHEYGDVSSSFDWPVEPGMIFSVEPGIYLPDDIGVRIEDLVIVTENGCEVINLYSKEPTVLELGSQKV